MIVDIHTHVYPDKIAQRAKESLEASFRVRLAAAPTVDSLLRHMDKNGIDVSVVNAVATRPDQVRSINDWAFSIRSERIRVFAALHPDYAGWEDELVRIRECADGVKFQPEFQGFYIDDEKVFPVYERCTRLKLPVLFHCGEELSGTMLVRSSPERVSAVHARFREMPLIAAHYGGFRMWEGVKKHLLGKDVYFDTAFFFSFLPAGEIVSMIAAHRPEKILFGTDFPLVDQSDDISFLKGLAGIPERLKQAIFADNAVRLLGMKKSEESCG
jgi:uncharacterized protein